jgi:hypothetical protein
MGTLLSSILNFDNINNIMYFDLPNHCTLKKLQECNNPQSTRINHVTQVLHITH